MYHYSPIRTHQSLYNTPLSPIEQRLMAQRVAIEQWFDGQWERAPAPFYGSVDVRHAGFKLAPVDTNLFPAGFNNLHPSVYPHIKQAIQKTFARIAPKAKRLLVIPEDHTRNTHYFEHIAMLTDLLTQAGFQVCIGSLRADRTAAETITLPSKRHLILAPIMRRCDRVVVGDFEPDLILSNNDFSSGTPEQLKSITQPIIPPLGLGWSSRLKSVHFRHYDRLVQSFAQQFDLDPWLIMPLFRYCGTVNFMRREGEACLLRNARLLLQILAQKHATYQIKEDPFVVVKADQGTYGMAVMSIEKPEDIVDLNRKRRTHMTRTKGGRKVNRVIMQEGVSTCETWQGRETAEMVVYMIGEKVVGAFYRVHPTRGTRENLNAPGMYFVPLAHEENSTEADDRFYPYTVVARLAQLAAAEELQTQLRQNHA